MEGWQIWMELDNVEKSFKMPPSKWALIVFDKDLNWDEYS